MKNPFRNRAGESGEVRRADSQTQGTLLDALMASYGGNVGNLAAAIGERLHGQPSQAPPVPEDLQQLIRGRADAQRELDAALERHNADLRPWTAALDKARRELAAAESAWTASPARLRFVAAQNSLAAAEDSIANAKCAHEQATADVRNRLNLATWKIERGREGFFPVNNQGLKFEPNWRPAEFDPKRDGAVPARPADPEHKAIIANGQPAK